MRTRRISISFASLSGAFLLAFIWTVMIWQTVADPRTDVDLGIATNKLRFSDAALWSLPISLAIWIGTISIAKALLYGFAAMNALRSKSASLKR